MILPEALAEGIMTSPGDGEVVFLSWYYLLHGAVFIFTIQKNIKPMTVATVFILIHAHCTSEMRVLSTKQGGQGGVGIHNRTHPDLSLNRRIIARTSYKVEFLIFAVYSDKPMLTLCQ